MTRHRVDPSPIGCEYSRVSAGRGEGPDAAAGAASCGFSPVDVAAARRSCRRAEGVVESPPKDRITLSLAPNARPCNTRRDAQCLRLRQDAGKRRRGEKTELTASMLRIPMMKRYQLEIWIQPFVLQTRPQSLDHQPSLSVEATRKSPTTSPRRTHGWLST